MQAFKTNQFHFSDWEGKLCLKNNIRESSYDFDIQKHCGDISALDAANSETASHSHLLLDWIRHFTEEHNMGILLDQLLRRKGMPILTNILYLSYVISFVLKWGVYCDTFHFRKQRKSKFTCHHHMAVFMLVSRHERSPALDKRSIPRVKSKN